jgi:amino acid transporter
MAKKIPLFSLVMLIVAAVGSIRNLALAAPFGPALIFFFVFAAIIFLIPTALVSAELSAAHPEEGGIYHWVRKAFGEKWGMLAIWLQWINTLIWCPTILAFIAGIGGYLIHPDLAEDKFYLMGSIIIIFWTLTILNLFGVNVSAKISAFCGLIGTLVPIALLIILGFIWAIQGNPLQIDITVANIFTPGPDYWVSLVAIAASFLGIELAGVHVGDIRNPQRNFPKAIILSSSIILCSMLFGALAIAIVLPPGKINLISGSLQAIDLFFNEFNAGWLTPIITVLMVIGSIGGLINWVISPAKGLLHAAEFGYLPRFLKKKNQNGVAAHILLIQAVIVSLVCSVFLFIPSVNGFYWFLTAVSTELYMAMYILMFLSALVLQKKPRPSSYHVPGGKPGLWVLVLLGLFGCSLTIVVSFIPPPLFEIAGHFEYALMIGTSNVIALLPLLYFFRYKKKLLRKQLLKKSTEQ